MTEYQKELQTKDKKRMKELNERIQTVLEEYSEEYGALADESDKLYDMEEKLKKKYDKLNQKTGLNELYSQVEECYRN